MRVIAGEFKSRALKAPEGLECRPTPDRLRESIFSILQPQLEGVTFLDAYAGSGSVGIEALSRGAGRAIFVERNRAHVDVLRANIKALGIGARSQVFTGKVTDVLKHQVADIVFVDPPYTLPEEYERVLAVLAEDPAPLVLVQHSKRQALPERVGALVRFRELKQGENSVSFYQRESAAE